MTRAQEIKNLLDIKFAGRPLDSSAIAASAFAVVSTALRATGTVDMTKLTWVIDSKSHQMITYMYKGEPLCRIHFKKIRGDAKQGFGDKHYTWRCGNFEVYINTNSGRELSLDERLREIDAGKIVDQIESDEREAEIAAIAESMIESGMPGQMLIDLAKYILKNDSKFRK